MQNDMLAAPVAQELAQTLGRLRRAVRQRTRQEWGTSPLPEAQLELLRLVRARPGLRPREAADALGVLPNTVSTLLKSLEGMGLLERRRDGDDARGVRMHLTAAAWARIANWQDQRQAVMAAALEALPPADQAAIAGSLPALDRLAHALGARPETWPRDSAARCPRSGGGDEQRRERIDMRDRAAQEPTPEMGCMGVEDPAGSSAAPRGAPPR